jgi:DNA polymerase III subunit delta'
MFIGHKKIINLLERSLKRGKTSQAYLFSGPEAVGKFTLAKIFAEALIKDSTTILRNMKVRDNISGLFDLIIIEPEREEKKGVIKEKDIKIEQIREAQKKLLLFPHSGKYKALIINNAHRMTISAQNSLLKALEEPNSTSVIILVAHDHSKVLPTLRSRCQAINFALVAEEEIAREIGSELAFLSLGRPGAVIGLDEKKEGALLRRESIQELKNITSMTLNQKLAMAEELSKNIFETAKKMELWVWFIRLEALKKGGSKKHLDAGFKRIEMIEKSLATLENTNASGRLVLENLLINL